MRESRQNIYSLRALVLQNVHVKCQRHGLKNPTLGLRLG